MRQNHVGQSEEELIRTKETFSKVEKERDQALDDLKDMKKVAEEAISRVDEALATRRLPKPQTRSNSAEVSLSNKTEELNTKDNDVESLKHESQMEKELEHQLGEKNDASLYKVKMEVDHQKMSDAQTRGLLFDCKKRIQELEAELIKRKQSEANLFDSLMMQTSLLELNKILLEESKVEIACLRQKLEALQGSAAFNMKILDEFQHGPSTKKTIDSALETGVQRVEKELTGADEVEKLASMKVESMLEEIRLLKNELKLAIVAEENSKNAMDDLALVLKEVATEANQMKEKLTLSQSDLEHTKGEAEHLRMMLQTTEDKYKELLDETMKEADRYKNTAERLRLEAEESHLAWNGKEMEFVNCIRRVEEERSATQKETNRLLELLGVAENKNKVSKGENQKLRDILKQALNEANVAKEAAAIARAENSQLQDSLAGKEKALNLLAQENEMLKIHEAAAHENIKELKRLLSESSVKELKNKDKEKLSTKEANKEDREVGRKASVHNATNQEQEEGTNLSKTSSFNLKEIKISHEKQTEGNEEANSETLTDDTLKGSIFDENATTTNAASHHDRVVHSDDSDHLDESQFDDLENDRNSRKRRALLQKFGYLIRRQKGTI